MDNASEVNQWLYTGDTSLVEPEILEEMGVSMLEDEESSLEGSKNEMTQEPVLSLASAEELRKTLAKERSCFDKDDVSQSSSFETVSSDR